MCGRFNLTDNPAVHALLNELGINIEFIPARYNIAPTESVLTLYHYENKYHAHEMRWWLTPFWSEGPSQKFAMFNARAETIHSSRAYKGPFQYRRAVVPASSFIEWQTREGNKQPFEIKPTKGCLFFAAVWDHWTKDGGDLYSCSIVTTAAVKSFEAIHRRQPVMLDHAAALQWLTVNQDMSTLKKLMAPKLPTQLDVTPIDKSIGNARNKQPTQAIGDGLRIF